MNGRVLQNSKSHLNEDLIISVFKKYHQLSLSPTFKQLCHAFEAGQLPLVLNEIFFLYEITSGISRYIAFQGHREGKNTLYIHRLEYSEKHYSSFPYRLIKSQKQPLDDIEQEKVFMIYTVNIIHAIEKNRGCSVAKIEIVYLKDEIDKV